MFLNTAKLLLELALEESAVRVCLAGQRREPNGKCNLYDWWVREIRSRRVRNGRTVHYSACRSHSRQFRTDSRPKEQTAQQTHRGEARNADRIEGAVRLVSGTVTDWTRERYAQHQRHLTHLRSSDGSAGPLQADRGTDPAALAASAGGGAGDSGFCREALMAWCKGQAGVDYVFGLAKNPRLKRALERQ